MVGRFVDVFGVYVAWCCGQVFLFFLLPEMLMDFR